MFLVAAGHRDRKAVADLDVVGVLAECRAGQYALGFVTDVQKDLLGGKRDDDAFQLALARFAAMGVALLEVAKQIGEGTR